MERCPNCRARFKGEPVCYRCGCELGRLLQIEAHAAALEKLAVHCLSVDLEIAEHAVEKALRLQRRPLALALREFIRHLATRRGGEIRH
jgi:hypothetical protein